MAKNSTFKTEDISLRDALAVVNNLDKASPEAIASARQTISKKMKEIESMYRKLNATLEALPEGEQGTLIFSNDAGDTTAVLTEEEEVISIDRKLLNQEAQPDVTVSYSDPVYADIYTVKPSASKKKILAAEANGTLPNASAVIKRTYITRTKLFDYKEEK